MNTTCSSNVLGDYQSAVGRLSGKFDSKLQQIDSSAALESFIPFNIQGSSSALEMARQQSNKAEEAYARETKSLVLLDQAEAK
mmetsp:Transcript_3398/g.4978  ORF Transcript_3398/g.4978 Transcript_3398/m.4978 type:complete len:83 (-) Transcript_3398:315-563(-)|eukprot:CAMPEP_0175092926 /NCGR_PEP_ID=MMETSP0086_2-20121207/2722_1 /TAXON_ID=136419 /ORGANISM="Unknown Unknown, Strain D1" /LENGTH=82 /DNA_ID=CAMNT_0016365819 /DNA_START=142 /DNA_END=390 /DNA_ORIENTATION=-